MNARFSHLNLTYSTGSNWVFNVVDLTTTHIKYINHSGQVVLTAHYLRAGKAVTVCTKWQECLSKLEYIQKLWYREERPNVEVDVHENDYTMVKCGLLDLRVFFGLGWHKFGKYTKTKTEKDKMKSTATLSYFAGLLCLLMWSPLSPPVHGRRFWSFPSVQSPNLCVDLGIFTLSLIP